MHIEERDLPRSDPLPIVTRKQATEYPENIIRAMHVIQFGNIVPVMGGSASIRSIKYFGDFDLITKIPKNYGARASYDQLENILIKTEKAKDFMILEEIKFQTDTQKYREMIDREQFDKIYKKLELVKYDYIVYANRIFYELSSIYAFKSGKGVKAYQDSIFNEIPEYIKEGNYFKVLKRYYSISNLNKDRDMLDKLTDFFNKYGKNYRIMSNLQAIEKVYKLDDSKETLQKIYDNLEDLGFNPKMKNFGKEIKKLFDELQKHAKVFYDENFADDG
jgi:hypothetical protein